MKSEGQNYKVILAAVLGHTLWGFSFMASRVALDVTNMYVLLSHRFILAWVIMSLAMVFHVAKIDLKGKPIRYLLYLGMAEPVVYFFGEQYGILHSNTIFSGVMIAMIPVVCTLAAAPILKERPTGSQFIFGLISVAGVIGIGFMSKSSGALEFGGVIGLVIAVLSAGVYTLMGRSLSKEFTPFERTYAMITVGAVVFTFIALIYCREDMTSYIVPWTTEKYALAIVFLALGCSVGGYFLTSYTITYLTVAKHTVFANLTTAVSVFAGAIFLREPFNLMGLFFCAMILLGIYGVQSRGKE